MHIRIGRCRKSNSDRPTGLIALRLRFCTCRAAPAILTPVYAFTVTVDIAATPARVWRALCDPTEVIQWDTGVVNALDAPANYPQPGQHVRWQYANGPFRILHDRPQEVVAERTLRALLAVGPFRFDETYTLERSNGGCRLAAALEVRVPLPVLGRAVERFYLGPRSQATVLESLQAIKRHCERSA